MKLAAQKNEYHWLPLSICDATLRNNFGTAFMSAMVVNATVSTAVLISRASSDGLNSQL